MPPHLNTRASVIVRCKDAAASIGRTFASLRSQTVDVEIVVVDSGSTDGTLALAREAADVLVEIPPASFTFGRALNIGAQHCSAPIHFALSAHCAPLDVDWIERALRWYEDPTVAATNGERRDPEGKSLREPLRQDLRLARHHPGWGFSNHAGSWRAAVWDDFRFDESMAASEDKEWAFRVLGAGWSIVYDPALWVSSAHRRQAGVRSLFERSLREARELSLRTDLPMMSGADAFKTWWSDLPAGSRYPASLYRLSPLRIAEIAGRWRGHRLAASARRR